MTVLGELDVTHADGYLRRGDVSRWIGDVFGALALGRKLQDHEREYVHSRSDDTLVRNAACHQVTI